MLITHPRFYSYFDRKINVNVTGAKVRINVVDINGVCVVPSYDGS